MSRRTLQRIRLQVSCILKSTDYSFEGVRVDKQKDVSPKFSIYIAKSSTVAKVKENKERKVKRDMGYTVYAEAKKEPRKGLQPGWPPSLFV